MTASVGEEGKAWGLPDPDLCLLTRMDFWWKDFVRQVLELELGCWVGLGVRYPWRNILPDWVLASTAFPPIRILVREDEVRCGRGSQAADTLLLAWPLTGKSYFTSWSLRFLQCQTERIIHASPKGENRLG